MNTNSVPDSRTSLHGFARLAGALAVSLLVAGCATTGGGAGASPTPPTDSPTPKPSTPSSANGFYLRAWQTQALAPQYTFALLPTVTISDGIYLDGQIAVPAIYPGQLWVGPLARTISAAGADAIVAEARKQGLLGTKSNFVDEPLPGGIFAHLRMTIDGKEYNLSGDPAALERCRCIPEPGTAGAFAAFWAKVTGLAGWLPAEIGASVPFEPERLAVLVSAPTEPSSGIKATQVSWPLATPFSSFGKQLGSQFRCGVVSGADLTVLLPAVRAANQLTRFVDSAGVAQSLQVRALVPGEASPCGS